VSQLAAWWRSLSTQDRVFAGFVGLIAVLVVAIATTGRPAAPAGIASAATAEPTDTIGAAPTAIAVTDAPIVAPTAASVTDEPVVAMTWPEFWNLDFCYAIDQIGDANGHIIEGADRGTSFDYDGAVEEAEQAAQDAREAQDALVVAGQWAPAHSVVVYLSSAADELEKAANLLKLGVQLIDSSMIEKAVKHQEKATYQINRAAPASVILAAKYGAPC
jgi:hypothetical protein